MKTQINYLLGVVLALLFAVSMTGCGRANCIAWQSATQQYPAVLYQPQSTSAGPAACPFNFVADVPANQVIKVIQ